MLNRTLPNYHSCSKYQESRRRTWVITFTGQHCSEASKEEQAGKPQSSARKKGGGRCGSSSWPVAQTPAMVHARPKGEVADS